MQCKVMKNEIINILEQKGIKANFGTSITGEHIKDFEKSLDLILPNSFKDFLMECGWIEIEGNDYLGYYGHDVNDPNTFIGFTQRLISEGMPKYLVAIHDDEDFGIVCIDTSQVNNSESPIMRWDPWNKEILEYIAPTFMQFLYNEINRLN